MFESNQFIGVAVVGILIIGFARLLFLLLRTVVSRRLSFSITSYFEVVAFCTAIAAFVLLIRSENRIERYCRNLNKNPNWEARFRDNKLQLEFVGKQLTVKEIMRLQCEEPLPISQFVCHTTVCDKTLQLLPRESTYELIDLSESNVDDKLVGGLDSLRVKEINLNGTNVTAKDFRSLERCTGLTAVSLAGCDLSARDLVPSLRPLELDRINLSYTNVENEVIERIFNETSIRDIWCLGKPLQRSRVKPPDGKNLWFERVY